jgi:hypothetical protein
MARIENYGNDTLVTLDDKVIGTDAVDNSTKNFTVGDIVALAGGAGGTTYTAGTGINITNGVISSTIVDTDTNNYISNVALNGTSLDFTGTAPAFSGSIPLGAIADQTVTIAGTNGITVTGTYPNFSISGAGVVGGYDWSLFADTGDLDPVTSGTPITFAGGTNVTTTFANNTLTIDATGVSGTGVVNTIAKWNTTSTLTGSLIIEDGSGVSVGVNPPVTRFHVHDGNALNTNIKLTTQNTGITATDGMDLSLYENVGGQIWIFENYPFRLATNNTVRFTVANSGETTFFYDTAFAQGLVDSSASKGTAGQILSSTGTATQWINAPSSAPAPENLILRLNSTSVATSPNPPGQDLFFAGAGSLVKTSSVHINPNDLNLANTQEIEIVNNCTVKVSLGAYIDNGGQAGQIIFGIYETSSGFTTLVAEAEFDLSNQASTIIPVTFFSFFDMSAGEMYIFTARSQQHAMTIVPGSFIEFEVMK